MRELKKAFTLIEFLVALLLTIVLVGGFTLTLNNITMGTRNAARSTDLTNLSRGVFKLLQADLYNVSKSFSDLNEYQIHFNDYQKNSVFYGISDLGVSTDGGSYLELQWFENHRKWDDGAGNQFSLPAHLSNSTWLVKDESLSPGDDISTGTAWSPTIPPLTFLSTKDADPDLADIKEGDYFIVYRTDLLFNFQLGNLKNLQDNVLSDSGLWDETVLNNGAMLLQAAAVENTTVPSDYGDSCPTGKGFLSAAKVTFGGSIFSNNLGTNVPLNGYTEPVHDDRCIGRYFSDEKTLKLKQFRSPDGSWVARKVGEKNQDFDSFNRVRYFLHQDPNGATSTLIREQNGQDMILASGVEAFRVQIGLDESDLATSWDGAVRMENTTNWISKMDDLPVGAAVTENLIGRHALAVKITITFKSLREDLQDSNASETGDSYKRRTFEQVIRLKNSHLPIGSL